MDRNWFLKSTFECVRIIRHLLLIAFILLCALVFYEFIHWIIFSSWRKP